MNKLLYIVGILAVVITGTMILINSTTEPVVVEAKAETSVISEWRVVEITSATETDVDTPDTENVTEAITEPSETIAETESYTESYYNVNLPEYIQDVIISECERYGIPSSIVIAMIERESQFQVYAMGDDGRSFGLMQIQPKWHLQRMIAMGCTDLFDPIQNVKVGIAILGDLKLQHNDIGWALTAYNSGSGGLNAYAMAVIERANEI
jgi:hypothetical protein